MFSSPKWRCFLSWIVGCASVFFSSSLCLQKCSTDSNTIGNIGSVASVDWGCAVQIMAAASIGSGLTFSPTVGQTLCVLHALLSEGLLYMLFFQRSLCSSAMLSCVDLQFEFCCDCSPSGSVHHSQRAVSYPP